MGNILEEFWYGNINPQEQSKESSQAIKELLKLMSRNRDRLHESMTAEQRETLEKYDDCVNEMYVSVKSGSVLTVKNPQTAKAELAACG